MFFEASAKYDYIFDGDQGLMLHDRCQNNVHRSLKSGQSVLQSKWHMGISVQATVRNERRHILVVILQFYLQIATVGM